ncbi:MAG: dUTP diphosphatase [Bacteroidia bacterium]|nr:dUTP diphosphatase [Bacteroidia bacterium]MCX7651902.1 dUTP diphosphatase [Bacteroidia bacterium]MDW8416053.1 dUTP diphosphatase [Bacteroidia bacterium]
MAPFIVKVRNESGLPLPEYATPGASGLDIRAAIKAPIVLAPGEWRAIPTGLYIELPEGYEAQVRPRSGLALRHGITLLNSPGTVDADYRGEIQVILINLGREAFRVEPGMRIAQLVITPVVRITWELVEELTDTSRSDGGFGHTGTQ